MCLFIHVCTSVCVRVLLLCLHGCLTVDIIVIVTATIEAQFAKWVWDECHNGCYGTNSHIIGATLNKSNKSLLWLIEKTEAKKNEHEWKRIGRAAKISICNLPSTEKGKIKVKIEQKIYKRIAFIKTKQMQTNIEGKKQLLTEVNYNGTIESSMHS